LIYKAIECTDFDNSKTNDKNGRLFNNSPNPFSKTTLISFEVDNPSLVEIKISDYLGRILETRNLGYKLEGKHSFTFKNNNLTQGIYFYSIYLNGEIIDSKKMCIIKK
jgi:hypothetical protein